MHESSRLSNGEIYIHHKKEVNSEKHVIHNTYRDNYKVIKTCARLTMVKLCHCQSYWLVRSDIDLSSYNFYNFINIFFFVFSRLHSRRL